MHGRGGAIALSSSHVNQRFGAGCVSTSFTSRRPPAGSARRSARKSGGTLAGGT